MHIDVLPGTEILDLNDSVDLVKSGKGSNSGIVLVPRPSRDPYDPLVSLGNDMIAGQQLLSGHAELELLELEASRNSEPGLLLLH